MPMTDNSPQINIPDHVSYSFLSSLDVCPLKWYGKYILRLSERKSGPQFLGTVVHDCIDRVHQGKVEATIPAILKDYHEGWESQRCWAEDDRDEVVDWLDIDWGFARPVDPTEAEWKVFAGRCEVKAHEFYEYGWRMLKLYFTNHHKNNPPMYHPTAGLLSEFQLNIDLEHYGGRHLKELVCRIDIVTEKGTIKDFKTKAFKKIPRDQFTTDLQPVIYAFAMDEAGLLEPPIDFRYAQLVYGSGFEFDDSVGGKIPAWKIDVFRQSVLPARLRTAEQYIEIAQNSTDFFQGHIRPGTYCKWCDMQAQNLCPFFQKKGQS